MEKTHKQWNKQNIKMNMKKSDNICAKHNISVEHH